MILKPITFFLMLFFLLGGTLLSVAHGQDTSSRVKDTVIKKRDTSQKTNRVTANSSQNSSQGIKKDSLKVLNKIVKDTAPTSIKTPSKIPATNPATGTVAQVPENSVLDSSLTDSSGNSLLLSTAIPDLFLTNTNKITDKVLAANKMINTKSKGTYFLQEIRDPHGKEFVFYLLCLILFTLAIFKTFFSMYFNNLFRIFFNTSLRQIQLTDQLSQAKLPSFILNIFFTISAGTYIWLLFTQFNKIQSVKSQTLLLICILSVAAIYLIKFIILKFIGWLAGIQGTVDNYIFVIFLVNKITGILIIPFLVLLSFFKQEWIPSVGVISALFIGLLFLSRYAKSYGALERKLSVNTFHLLIFIAGAEVIPILIFYKIAVDYFI